jgi:fructose-bisphosphate aldolase class II
MSLELLGSAAIEAARRARIPVAVHLDHARDMELVHRALEMGFSSVMLDGSSLPLNQNIDLTGQVIQVARAAGATAEGEVGIMGHADRGDTGVFSDPDQAVLFAQETGVDFLAVSVGSIHGMKTQKARLNMELLEKRSRARWCFMEAPAWWMTTFAEPSAAGSARLT